MSNELYPELKGIKWDVSKTPNFSTEIQQSVNLQEVRASFAATPVWDVKVSYEFLRQYGSWDELHTLAGFFMARYGAWDSFLFRDPYDSVAANQPIGIGDGVIVEFQLQRAWASSRDRVSNYANAVVYVNGAAGSNYAIASNGAVTFNAAPAPSANITWSGEYYYRCRFKDDASEFNQFNTKLWEARTVEFKANLGTKLL